MPITYIILTVLILFFISSEDYHQIVVILVIDLCFSCNSPGFSFPSCIETAMEITQILLSAQSPDAGVRTEAEASLGQFQEKNLPAFLFSLSYDLLNDEKPIEYQRLAGIILKNSLDAKDDARKNLLVQQWLGIETAIKSQIKELLLRTLGSPS